jgi:hypothetical protein
MRTAGQTVRSIGRLAEDTETDAADKTHINHLPMAETRSAEINVHTGREYQMTPRLLVWKEGEHEILEESSWSSEGHVNASGGVAGLLEEDGVAGEFTDVNGNP